MLGFACCGGTLCCGWHCLDVRQLDDDADDRFLPDKVLEA